MDQAEDSVVIVSLDEAQRGLAAGKHFHAHAASPAQLQRRWNPVQELMGL
jgi:hypothetical protein